MTTRASVVVVSRFHPAPGCREGLRAAIAEVAELTAAAGGCYGARACESDQDSDALVCVSRWESDDAREVFENSSAATAGRDGCAHFLARPATEERFRPY
ncbi:MAG: putative quinol monooxygenase [Candidatus Dormibacteria bacterium]